jgi:hypothetical protein
VNRQPLVSTLCISMFLTLIVPGLNANDTAPSSGYYVHQRHEDRKIVIVFIHGFTGNDVDTWKNKDTGKSFPEMIATDPDFKDADVYVYAYHTSAANGPGQGDKAIKSIPRLGETLSIKLFELLKGYKKVVLVGHSMGGLVALSALDTNRTRLVTSHEVPMIYTFATPHAGVNLPGLAKLWNPEVADLFKEDENSFLQAQTLHWIHSSTLQSVDLYCAAEGKPTKVHGISLGIIVDENSAFGVSSDRRSGVCKASPRSIIKDADHIAIVKPRSKDSDSYKAFKAAYLESKMRW